MTLFSDFIARQKVYFGTTAGQLIVMDVHGAMVSEVQLAAGVTSMAWSAEKFTMEEDERCDRSQKGINRAHLPNLGIWKTRETWETPARRINAILHVCASTDDRNYVLAVCLADGNVVMLRSFDDVSPITIRSNLKPPLQAEWSNSRKLLAIAGTKESEVLQDRPQEYTNLLKFYSVNGTLVYTTEIPYTQVRRKHALSRCGKLYNRMTLSYDFSRGLMLQCPVSALTWGHNDRRLFVATGARVHAAWVSRWNPLTSSYSRFLKQ